MADTIELLKLNLDTDKLISDLVKTEKAIEDLGRSTIELKRENEALMKSNQQMAKDGKKNSDAYLKNTEAIKQNKEAIKQNNTEVKSLTQTQKKQKKVADDWKIANEKGGQSINAMRKQLSLVTKEWTKLTTEEIKNTKKGKELNKAKTDLTKKLKELESATGDNRRNVGNYSDALGKLKLGYFAVAGAITGAIAGAIASFKSFDNAINRINQNITKTAYSFDISRESAKGLHTQIQVMADVWDKDFNEVLKASSVFAKEFGISGKESLQLVNEGFLKGADINGEYLELLKEYPTQLKQVGLDAKETIAIITQTEQMGIFSDKGIDAIKEAGLRLRENNKATSDALKVLDEQTQKEIELAIAKGDTFKAIQLISEELNGMNLTAQESQTIIADVFGGAGEDAGLRYLQSLKDINTELTALPENISETEKATNRLTTAWSTFTNDLLAKDSPLTNFWTSIKNGIAGALEYAKYYSTENKNLAKYLETYTTSVANGDLTINQIKQRQLDLIREIKKASKEDGQEAIQKTKLLKQAFDEVTQSLINRGKIQKEVVVEETTKTKELTKEELNALQKRKDAEMERFSKITGMKQQESDKDTELLNKMFTEVGLRNEQVTYEVDHYIAEQERKKEEDIRITEELEAKKLETKQMAIDGAFELIDIYQQYQDQNSDDELRKLQELRQKELAIEGLTESQKETINNTYDDKEKAVQKEQFERNKKYAIADIQLKAAMAILGTWSGYAEFGPYGAVMAGIQTATIGGVATAKSALVIAQKFEKGGAIEIGGKPHSQGGTTFRGTDGTVFEAEKDENLFILNKNASRHIDELSDLNVKYGGKPFGTGRTYLQAGGSVARATSISNETEKITQSVSVALTDMPAPIVSVEEIKEVGDHITTVQESIEY